MEKNLLSANQTFIFLSIGRIFDIVTTYIGVIVGGKEFNPVTNYFISNFGKNFIWILIPLQITIMFIATVLIYTIIRLTIKNHPNSVDTFNMYLFLLIVINFIPAYSNLLVLGGFI